jgi:hypothetical protein
VRSCGEPTAIIVCETEPMATKLTPQEPVLFNQVCNHLSFPPVQPAGNHPEKQLQRRGVDHKPELISSLARTMSADLWNTSGLGAKRRHRPSGNLCVRVCALDA